MGPMAFFHPIFNFQIHSHLREILFKLIVIIPFSSLLSFILSLTIITFLNESGILIKGLIS